MKFPVPKTFRHRDVNEGKVLVVDLHNNRACVCEEIA